MLPVAQEPNPEDYNLTPEELRSAQRIEKVSENIGCAFGIFLLLGAKVGVFIFLLWLGVPGVLAWIGVIVVLVAGFALLERMDKHWVPRQVRKHEYGERYLAYTDAVQQYNSARYKELTARRKRRRKRP